MFSVETRVNGNLVAHLYVRNTLVSGGNGDEVVYDVGYFRPSKEKNSLVKLNVLHDPKDGLEKLISKIYS